MVEHLDYVSGETQKLVVVEIVCHDEVLIIITEVLVIVIVVLLLVNSPQPIHYVCKDEVLGCNETSCTSSLYRLWFLLSQEARVASSVRDSSIFHDKAPQFLIICFQNYEL
jgi:hypothetical protein